MRRLATLTLSLVCFAMLSTACQEEGYDCTASFYEEANGALLSTKEYAYDDADDAEEAADMCQEEAGNDQPDSSTYFSCKCESR